MNTTSPSPARVAALLMKHPPGAQDASLRDDRDERLAHAVGLLRSEAFDEADEAFNALLQRHPRDADGLHFQGILRHVQGRTDEALELLRESLARSPDEPGHWNNYGNVLLEQGRLDAAAEAYRMSVTLGADGGNAADAYNNLSTLHRRRHDYVEAEAWARRVVDAKPDVGDGWYNLSVALMKQGRIREALIANSKAIALWPRHLQARDQVIRALMALGEHEQAAELYREWLAEDPDNPIVRHQLAACIGEDAPDRASDACVELLFDAFAASFDAKLDALGYQAPQLVAKALAEHLPAAQAQFDIVDLGCGTGLVGPLIRPWARSLAGCDLSVGMLRKAKARACYGVLHKAELVHYLQTQPGAFDIAVSADTLCYFGVLDEAMKAAASALRPGGVFAFTVEALPEGAGVPHALQPQGRYAHARAYVSDVVADAGLTVLRIDSVTLRMELAAPVMGWLVVARC
jgi:predicted TPR repeat methyltransferase